MTVGPLADVQAEAERVLSLAADAGVAARLLGGVAVALHRHGVAPPALRRVPADIDLVVKRGHDRLLRRLLEDAGYVGDKMFNSLRGDRRLLYFDQPSGRQLDVFIGTFAMSHELDLDRRLDRDPRTLDPADLLLTKLQVVEINRKDLVDALSLMVAHEVTETNGRAEPTERAAATAQGTVDAIDLDRVVAVTCSDWGWYTTFSDNLAKLRSSAPDLLEGPDLEGLTARLDRVTQALHDSRKSLGWKARARLGRRVKWYELPEEVKGEAGG